MTSIDLQLGDANVDIAPQITQSPWRQGLSHRRRRNLSTRPVRTWRATWSNLGQGGVDYLRMIFTAGAGGAAVLDWTSPGGDELKVRMKNLRINRRSAAAFDASADLEEVIEPC